MLHNQRYSQWDFVHAVTTAIRNGDTRVSINMSTVLASIFGVIVIAVGSRVFLNALQMTEIQTLLKASVVSQTEFRERANSRFISLETDWERETDLMRNELTRFEGHVNTMWYRVRRTEDRLGIEANVDEYKGSN